MSESTAEAQKTGRIRPTKEDKRLIKADYLHGRGSLLSLARKYGLSRYTVRHWSDAEKWTELRQTVEDRLNEAMVPPGQDKAQSPPDDGQNRAGKVGQIMEQLKQIDSDLSQPNLEPLDRLRLSQAKANLWNLIYAKPVQPKRARRGLAPELSPAEPIEPEPKP